MDAISARERAIKVEPIPAKRLPYTRDAGPPFSKLNWKDTPEASHAAWRVKPKLTMAVGLIYRCRGSIEILFCRVMNLVSYLKNGLILHPAS
jgi:hypothetical protein